VAFGDNPFWERNAYAEALLAIGMAVLEKVVPNLFVGQSLECFRELYPVVVDDFFGDISGQVFLPFVRMLSKAEPPVEALDFFLAGGLDLLSVDAQNLPWGRGAGLTLETPKTSYGSQILGIVLAVTTIRYIIQAITSQPPVLTMPLFNLRSRLFCFLRCPSIRSA
jgi:hypothetical protein